MLKRSFSLFLFLGLFFSLGPLVRADFTTPAKNISNSSPASLYPKIVSLPGTNSVFVVWIEVYGSAEYLYFSRSTDGGTTWSTPFQLTTEGQIRAHSGSIDDWEEDSYTFSMAVRGNYIHIVFQWRIDESDDFEIIYLRSSDLGATAQNWDILRYMTDNATDSIHPDVAVAPNLPEYVQIAYTDSWPGNKEIMYKRLTGHGSGNMLTRRLTFSSTDSTLPRIAVADNGNHVYIVYQDWLSGNWGLMYKNIAMQGSGPYSTYRLTTSSAWNGFPDIAVSAGSPPEDQYVYIVYRTNYPGPEEIMYKRLDQYGIGTFNTYTARLTYSGSSLSSFVDFDDASNCVHITYYDYWPGNFDIMHKKFENFGGAGFATQRVSWGTGNSFDPTISAYGNGAYIAWSDSSSGNYEILVKKGD